MLDRPLNVADLPTELSTAQLDRITLRLLLQSGSVRVKQDGTISWAIDKVADVNTSLSNIDNDCTSIYNAQRDVKIWFHHSDIGASATGTQATMGGTAVDFTLAVGAIAATLIYDPAGTDRFHVLGFFVSSDLAGAAGGQNYKLIVTEETAGTNYGTFNFNSLNQPVYIPLNAVGTAVDQDLLVQVSGGSAAEHLQFWVIGSDF